MTRKHTHDEFVELFKAKNPHANTLRIVGTYTGIDDPIECQCLVCGYQWSPIASLLLHRGIGCKACSNAKKSKEHLLSHEEFISKLENVDKASETVEILGFYRGRDKPIECKCRICGNIWQPTPNNLLKGKGCPRCAHAQTSFFEQYVLHAFRTALGIKEVRSRDRKVIGKELDIFIPACGIAYEVGSWYWHKNRVDDDCQKHKLCNEKGIRLIVVYDGCATTKPPLEQAPFEDCIIYQQDLGSDHSAKQLKAFVEHELKRMGVRYEYSDDDWNRISSLAAINSRAMSGSDFRDLVAKNNPHSSTFAILGEFASGDKTIECECSVCGAKWKPKARRLIEGYGCPECKRRSISRSRRKTHDEFLNDFMKKNPNSSTISFLSRYVTSRVPIQCHCNICGFEWSASPENLLGAKLPGCPRCGRAKCNKSHMKTQDQFEADFLKANKHAGEITLGKYTGVKNKIECHCHICGHEWWTMPSNLLAGKGCPNWRSHKTREA